MEGKVAVVNSQHHVSEGLEKGLPAAESGKINDIFKNLRAFASKKTETSRELGQGRLYL